MQTLRKADTEHRLAAGFAGVSWALLRLPNDEFDLSPLPPTPVQAPARRRRSCMMV